MLFSPFNHLRGPFCILEQGSSLRDDGLLHINRVSAVMETGSSHLFLLWTVNMLFLSKYCHLLAQLLSKLKYPTIKTLDQLKQEYHSF